MHKLKKYIAFLYIYLCTGFTLGTLTLALVVESLVAYSRKTGWMNQYENTMVIVIIVIFIIYSLCIAMWLSNSFFQYKRVGKTVLLLILTISTGYSLWYWFTPKVIPPDENYITSQDGRFVAGPYPDAYKMQYLKNNGFTAIITLLSPYVVPFEPILLNKETKLANEFNIPVIHFPMLPWITKNTDSIEKIKALASEHNHNKYYVHCYYGRDRVSMFMRIVDQVSPVNVLANVQPVTKPQSQSLSTLPFENGTGYLVNKRVIFSPVPTEDELAMYVVNIDKKFTDIPIESVISIDTTAENVSLQTEALKKYGIAFNTIIGHDYPYDPIHFLELARKLKAKSGGILVYESYTSPNVIPAALEGTMYSYITDLPALPYSVMRHFAMANGSAEQIGVNLLVGPHPNQNEYSHELFNIGIRAIAYIGLCDSSQSRDEEAKARNAKIPFHCYAPDEAQLEKIFSENGPWYVYGPQVEQIEDKLEAHFLKTIPKMDVKP